jgi:hypothetical protein
MFFSIIISSLFVQPALAKKVKQAPQPCWVTQACAPYTTENYLIGVGSGLDLASANTAALGSLSQQLTVTVQQQQTSMKENSSTIREQQQLSSTDHQTLRTKTKVSAAATLERVEYIEHWTQYRKGSEPLIYTLAVIDRTAWVDQMSADRRTIQSQISQHRMTIQKNEHILDSMPEYRTMVPLVEQDQMLFAQQQLIEHNPTVMPPSYTVAQIESEIRSSRTHMPIALNSNNDPDLNRILQRKLEQSQFTVAENPTTVLSCSGEPMMSGPDGYGFYKYTLQTQCELRHRNVSVWSETYTSQAASRDQQKAESQLWTVVDKDLSSLQQHLLELFAL